MNDSSIIASDRDEKIAPTNRRSGFFYQWGPQAWIDMWMSDKMLVKKASLIVSHTLLPILRLSCDDREKLEQDYQTIRARREVVKLFEAPREKWRKRYGNFVREVEWALLELRKYYSQAQYEDIVIGTSVATSHETSADFLAMMNSMPEKNKRKLNKKKKASKSGSTEPGRISKVMFEMFNPAGWLTGPATITELDPANGRTVIHIPECGWHVCAKQSSLPNPDALPEEGCLNICKGPFEALFKGENGGLKMEFEPHLPETSCTVRMTWAT
ncbi:MAG: hypothetical protein AB8B48_01580 [Pseudomonadales bacterium]